MRSLVLLLLVLFLAWQTGVLLGIALYSGLTEVMR